MALPQLPSLSQLLSMYGIVAGSAAVAIAIYALFRSKTADVLRGERDAYMEKCVRLQDEMTICKEESHAKDIEITDLRAKTDLTDLMKNQAAMLTNQTQMLELARDTQTAMAQLTTTLQAMERRLDQGLIMR